MAHVPTYLLYGEAGIGEPEFWLHCETIRSRSSRHRFEIRPHLHEKFFQILYIAAGSGDALLDARRLALEPHTVVMVPPHREHGFRFSRDVDGFVLTILTSHLDHQPGGRSDLGQWLSDPRSIRLDVEDEAGRGAVEALNRLAREFDDMAPGRDEVLKSYFTIVVHLLFRLSAERSEHPHGPQRARLQHLQSLIHRDFRLHKPVSHYANALGLSVTHLNRLARAELGCTVHDLITAKILDEAKRHLIFSMTSVQQTADRLGFHDAAYFSRFFLKHTGESPRDWRIHERARMGGL